MSSNELDRLREDVIEKIKRAFPIGAPFDGKLTSDWASQRQSERLSEMLAGKNWLEVVTHPSVIYNLSDVDHVLALTGEAQLYYLPALLVATLRDPGRFIYVQSVCEEISELAASFSIQQLKAVMDYLGYVEQCERLEIISVAIHRPNTEKPSAFAEVS